MLTMPSHVRGLLFSTLCCAAQLLACTHSDDVSTTDADASVLPDGNVPAEASVAPNDLPSPIEDYVRQSENAWGQLEQQHGGTYWYELEDCVVNSMLGKLHLIQVENGKARKVGSREFPAVACRSRVNALGITVGTIPELYQACRALSLQPQPLNITLGAPPSHCWNTSPQCSDNCGNGFALRNFGWGVAPNWGDQPGPGCLSQTVRWGQLASSTYQGASNTSELPNALRPCRRYDMTSFDGGVCTHPIVSDAGVDVGDLNAALAHRDVVAALAGDGGLRGAGPWTGARILRVAVELDGGTRHIDISEPCEAGIGTGCTPIEPGVLELRELLETLDEQQRPLSDCQGRR